MNKDDILKCINFGRYEKAIIDRRILPEYSSHVREIAILVL
jgi:hypothetical protein